MKLAWLCYNVVENSGCDLYHEPTIVFQEPPYWKYHKVVPIVYMEIVE